MFKDPDETFLDTETMEGGSIEFKQVGGDSFGLKEPVAVCVVDFFCELSRWPDK